MSMPALSWHEAGRRVPYVVVIQPLNPRRTSTRYNPPMTPAVDMRAHNIPVSRLPRDFWGTQSTISRGCYPGAG